MKNSKFVVSESYNNNNNEKTSFAIPKSIAKSYVKQISNEERLKVKNLPFDRKKEYACNYVKCILKQYLCDLYDKGIAAETIISILFTDNSCANIEVSLSDETINAIYNKKCNLTIYEQNKIANIAISKVLTISLTVLSTCNIPCEFDYFVGIVKPR